MKPSAGPSVDQGALNRVLAALQANEDRLPNKRVNQMSRSEFLLSVSRDDRDQFVHLNSFLPNGPPMKLQRLVRTAYDFLKYHVGGNEAIGRGLMVGKERTKADVGSE